jgi:hypothetical protein
LRRIVGSLPRVFQSLVIVLTLTCAFTSPGQEAKPSAKQSTPAATEKNPAQIELLETKYRFEANGDSRKEVHARVRINNELGVRQFARLNFDFNRSFQSVEIPLVRITHTSGGVADILPSAITDNPNPAVVDFPAYHDVRVKSVRILGLQPDDLLEYRVITTTTHHPLAPDFWLDHTFDRSGVVTEEHFEIDVPASRKVQMHVATQYTYTITESESSTDARVAYGWNHKSSIHTTTSEEVISAEPDISISSFISWKQLSEQLSRFLTPSPLEPTAVFKHCSEFQHGVVDGELTEAYECVSQKIRTVDLPLDATGFRTRQPIETLNSGYASAEDKVALFAATLGTAQSGFVLNSAATHDEVPSPARFKYLLARGSGVRISPWLDLSSEVAPQGMVPASFRGRPIFVASGERQDIWETVPKSVLYHASQGVAVAASLNTVGDLAAKIHYKLRGDNELLLRVAFHKTPKEKWKDVAQLLAISDGFRGEIKNVTASDAYVTDKPFEVEYEIEQPKFVDWSRKTVRILALLPSPSLPDATPTTASTGDADKTVKKKIIDLGTPLDIELTSTVQLPPGTTALAPTGTSVERDYATFSSRYSVTKSDSATGGTIIAATRKLRFLLKEIPAERAADFNAFLHAVQSDQLQLFTLQPAVKTKEAP